MGRTRSDAALPGQTSVRPGGRAPGAAPRATRAAGSAQSTSEAPRFDRRFWTWTLLGALAGGLLLLSVSWDPATRPVGESLGWGAFGFVGWIAGAVIARLVRRRLAAG